MVLSLFFQQIEIAKRDLGIKAATNIVNFKNEELLKVIVTEQTDIYL